MKRQLGPTGVPKDGDDSKANKDDTDPLVKKARLDQVVTTTTTTTGLAKETKQAVAGGVEGDKGCSSSSSTNDSDRDAAVDGATKNVAIPVADTTEEEHYQASTELPSYRSKKAVGEEVVQDTKEDELETKDMSKKGDKTVGEVVAREEEVLDPGATSKVLNVEKDFENKNVKNQGTEEKDANTKHAENKDVEMFDLDNKNVEKEDETKREEVKTVAVDETPVEGEKLNDQKPVEKSSLEGEASEQTEQEMLDAVLEERHKHEGETIKDKGKDVGADKNIDADKVLMEGDYTATEQKEEKENSQTEMAPKDDVSQHPLDVRVKIEDVDEIEGEKLVDKVVGQDEGKKDESSKEEVVQENLIVAVKLEDIDDAEDANEVDKVAGVDETAEESGKKSGQEGENEESPKDDEAHPTLGVEINATKKDGVEEMKEDDELLEEDDESLEEDNNVNEKEVGEEEESTKEEDTNEKLNVEKKDKQDDDTQEKKEDEKDETAVNKTARASAGGRRSTFPEKLMELLNDKNYNQAMTWLPNGNAFALFPKEFMTDVLPKHFEGTKFESFTRKLNRWGFKRIAGEDAPDDTYAYSHHLFKREFPELCRGMSGGKKLEQDFSHLIRFRERERMMHSSMMQPSQAGLLAAARMGFPGMAGGMTGGGMPGGIPGASPSPGSQGLGFENFQQAMNAQAQQAQLQQMYLERQLAAAQAMNGNPFGNFGNAGGGMNLQQEYAIREMVLRQQASASGNPQAFLEQQQRMAMMGMGGKMGTASAGTPHTHEGSGSGSQGMQGVSMGQGVGNIGMNQANNSMSLMLAQAQRQHSEMMSKQGGIGSLNGGQLGAQPTATPAMEDRHMLALADSADSELLKLQQQQQLLQQQMASIQAMTEGNPGSNGNTFNL